MTSKVGVAHNFARANARGIFSPPLESILNPPLVWNLCPTCWTVKAASLESICLNCLSLLATWEEAADVVKQTDVKARICGVAAKMKK